MSYKTFKHLYTCKSHIYKRINKKGKEDKI